MDYYVVWIAKKIARIILVPKKTEGRAIIGSACVMHGKYRRTEWLLSVFESQQVGQC